MESTNTCPPVSKKMIWAGRIMSALPVLLLTFSGIMKFTNAPDLIEGFEHLGLPIHLAIPLGILELSCVIIYVIPRTQVIGAILITGYMGGAMLTHLRLGEAIFMHIILGILVWGGLYLRDRRIRALIPFTTPRAK